MFLTISVHGVIFVLCWLLPVLACTDAIFKEFTHSTLITCHVLTYGLLLCPLHMQELNVISVECSVNHLNMASVYVKICTD
jgi:hypothetical protein